MGFTKEAIPIYILSNMVLIFIYWKYFTIYFDRSAINKKLEFLCFSLFYLVNTSTCIIFQQPVLNLLTTVVPLFLIGFLYPSKTIMRIFVALQIVALNIVMDNSIYLIFKIFLKEVSGTQVFFMTGWLLDILLFWIYLIIAKLRNRSKQSQLDALQWLAILLVPSSSLFVIVYTYYSSATQALYLIISIVLVAINILVFYLYDKLNTYYISHYEKQLLEQQNRAYEDSFALMRQSEHQVSVIRHDMRNHITVMQHYLDEAQTEELKSYLERFTMQLTKPIAYVKTGNPELDSILNYKLSEAERVGAKLRLDIKLPEKLPIATFDLNVILGNLLDNAIEGLEKSSDKQLWLFLRVDRGVLLTKVENSFDGIVKKEKTPLGFVYQSRKAGSLHGIGLESVKSAIEKYHGQIELSHTDKLFTANVVLYLE